AACRHGAAPHRSALATLFVLPAARPRVSQHIGSERPTMNLPFQPPLAPMEARHVDALPSGAGWQYEPKWDGFRAICFRDGSDVYISSRKELPFNRYFPEIVAAAKSLPERRFVLDGEIVVFTADGVVAKRLDAPYRSGEREMLKVKRERTADCVVLGFRWAKDLKGEAVGSLLLGLYGPDHELWQVGFTSGFTQQARRELVPFLKPYRDETSAEPPPGIAAMSRWS